MKESEINPVTKLISNINTGSVLARLTGKDDFVKFDEIPPYIVDDKGNDSYKHLGTEKTTRGENIQKYSVRKKNNRKDKHFTLVWSGIIKNEDIRKIEDEDNIRDPETIKKFKMVTSRLRLPKRAVKNLRNDYNEFLYPTPKKVEYQSELFEILKQRYALDILKHFSEKEELTMEEFKHISKIGTNNSSKCLKSFIKLGLLRSYKQGRSGIKIYRITLEKTKIAKIMDVLID